MSAKRRILIVEDHQLFREGLKALLSDSPEWEVCCEASDGLEALHLAATCKPDLVLLDLSMPRMNGFSVLREIKVKMPAVKVLVLSIHESDQYVLQAFQSQADGYAVKDRSRDELRTAIETILRGQRYLSPSIARPEEYMGRKDRKEIKNRTEEIKSEWPTRSREKTKG